MPSGLRPSGLGIYIRQIPLAHFITIAYITFGLSSGKNSTLMWLSLEDGPPHPPNLESNLLFKSCTSYITQSKQKGIV